MEIYDSEKKINELERRQTWLIKRTFLVEKQKSAKWWLSGAVLVMFALVFAFLILPVKDLLVRYEQKLSAELNQSNGMDAKFRTVQQRVGVLLTESIEARLSEVEQKILSGQIGASDVSTIQELKRDLGVLKSFSFQPDAYSQVALSPPGSADALPIVQNSHGTADPISGWQNVVHAGLVSIGGLALVIGSFWFQARYGQKALPSKRASLPRMHGE